MKFLVIGCGSIGERHIGNLLSLSSGEVLAYDTDSERLSVVNGKYKVTTFTDLAQALNQKVDAFIICVPPSLHLTYALEGLKHNAHLFIEKPISHTINGVAKLNQQAKAKNLIVYVGYNLRFHPGLQMVKQLLDQGKIGKLLSVSAEVGQYLPDWRPQQDYRRSYTARKELGGGIILDGSHELDYVRWLIGAEVKEVACFADKVSQLEVNTEDNADILLKFSNNITANVHLDFIQRGYSRSCKLIGEEGTITWSYPEKKVKLYTAATKKWQETDIQFEPNEMYIAEMKHFIRCVKGEEKPAVDGATGQRVLEIALATKKSAAASRVIKL
jgi:predicted dehydrogenase